MLNLPVCLQKRGRALVIFNEKYVQYRFFLWQIIPLFMHVLSSQVEPRTLSQGHKKNPRPRPRTALLRTDPLEAKDRNAQGRAGASVLRKKKGFRRSSNFFFKRSKKKKKSSRIFFKPRTFLRTPPLIFIL